MVGKRPSRRRIVKESTRYRNTQVLKRYDVLQERANLVHSEHELH